MRDLSEQYPCLYGLREHCEALGFAFRILSGEIERALGILGQATPESKTDEERFVARLWAAYSKQLPAIFASARGPEVRSELIHVIRELCDLCPHRLNAIKPSEARGTATVELQPLPPGPSSPPQARLSDVGRA